MSLSVHQPTTLGRDLELPESTILDFLSLRENDVVFQFSKQPSDLISPRVDGIPRISNLFKLMMH